MTIGDYVDLLQAIALLVVLLALKQLWRKHQDLKASFNMHVHRERMEGER